MDKAELAARLTWWHFALLVLVPVIANAGILTGFSHCDPEFIYSGLSSGLRPGFLPGAACFVDPAVAYITQPLGHLSAEDWLHGIIPWWNPYNGIGMPLAAEMQDEAFFLPFVLLLHFHNGWLLQRLIFQILSGFFTYLFLVSGNIRLSGQAALLGALLFALNGSFILTAGAPSGPIFCLPLLLLGIEKTFTATLQNRALGWSLIVIAVALSIYSGFVEVAYFDGLLAGAWTMLRLWELPAICRSKFIFKIISALGIGLGLSAPQLVPFAEYLQLANTGAHSVLFAGAILPPTAALIQLFPLFYGALALPQTPEMQPVFGDMWVRFGGWFGGAPALLALYSVIPWRKQKSYRYVLAVWVMLWEGRYFGLFGVREFFNLIPGLAHADAIRFSWVCVEFAVFCLAAAGYDDLAKTSDASRKRFYVIVVFVGIAALTAMAGASGIRILRMLEPNLERYQLAYMSGSTIMLVVTAIAFFKKSFVQPLKIMILAGAVFVFLMPQLSAFRGGVFQPAEIKKLQYFAKDSRFYTIGPFSPNIAAGYNISSINYSQLPVPDDWANFISHSLFPGANVIDFQGNQPNQLFYFVTNIPVYEDLGVQYLVTPPGLNLANWQPAPVAVTAPGGPVVINGQSEIEFSMPVAVLATVEVTKIRINFMNDFGLATGILRLQVCALKQCAQGAVDITHTPNRANVEFVFDHPLQLSGTTKLDFMFAHPSGGALALWLPAATPNSGQIMPPKLKAGANGGVLDFVRDASTQGLIHYRYAMMAPAGFVPAPMARVFQGQAMDIYILPGTAPLATVGNNGCSVRALSWQHFSADCAHADTLVWRELFYPGWHAMVNGKPVAISQQGDIFQAVQIAAGVNDIWFYYQPPYSVLAFVAALMAVLFWLLCLLRARQAAFG